MKSEQFIDANSELKNPYVLLERLRLEDNNDYNFRPEPDTNGYSLIHSSPEELNYANEPSGMVALNFMSRILDSNGKLFRSYVLLERLSPQDIQNLSTKKN